MWWCSYCFLLWKQATFLAVIFFQAIIFWPKRNWKEKTGIPAFLSHRLPENDTDFSVICRLQYITYRKQYFCSITKSRVSKGARKEWLQVHWDFVKLSEWWKSFVTFLTAMQKNFWIPLVLHAVFFFPQALAGIFFRNHPPPPLPWKVIWLTPYEWYGWPLVWLVKETL